MGRAPTLRALPRPPAPAEARLALAEFLLACDSPADCAQWGLDWLAEHGGLKRGACLGYDDSEDRLTLLAAYRVSTRRLPVAAGGVGRRDDALGAALEADDPVVLTLGVHPEQRPAPVERSPLAFLAIPLRSADGAARSPHGLLLVNPPAGETRQQALWLAEVLGTKLGGLRVSRVVATARQRLEQERALLQTIINAVPDPVLLTDTEGRMLLANTRAEALLASTERESEGRRRAIALNNMLFSAALAGWAIEGPEPQRRELLLVDPDDGSDLLFELISAMAQAPGGRGIVSILRNVSDLRRATEEMEEHYRRLREAEAQVRAERDRLDLIIDSVADPILVTDPGGATLLMNAPAERLFTASADAPSEVAQRVRSNDAHFSSFLANLMFSGDAVRHRGQIGLVDPRTGETLPVEAVAGKILAQQEELVGVVTILHDRREAMERERLYEQLKRASAELEEKVRQATAELVWQNELLRRQALQLEQASALKTQFLANMSHEFRTPLNAILGYTSLLLQGVPDELTPAQRKSVSRVDSSARHLLALISDILDITRIEAGKMPLHLDEFTLPELVAEMIA